MDLLQEVLLLNASTTPAVLIVSLVKASLVLGLVQVIAAAVHSLSAATRHLLLTAGLASFLVIPLLSLFGPAWLNITIEPEANPAAVNASSNDLRLAGAESLRGAGVHHPGLVPPAVERSGTIRFGAGESAALVWMLIALGVLGRLVRSAVLLRSIVADAATPSVRLLGLLRNVKKQLSIDAPVRLLQSDRIKVPMVWGVCSGTLLLPRDAEGWTEENLRATFIHELGHLQRLDYVSLALMNLVSALVWFHPQVWVARRRALREGERACDDLVLGSGGRASDYASHLLHVASLAKRRESLGAFLAMSRPSQLEGRLQAILSASVNRQAIGRKALLILLGSFLASAVLVAGVQVAAQPQVPAHTAAVPRPATVSTSASPVSNVIAPAGPPAPVAAAPSEVERTTKRVRQVRSTNDKRAASNGHDDTRKVSGEEADRRESEDLNLESMFGNAVDRDASMDERTAVHRMPDAPTLSIAREATVEHSPIAAVVPESDIGSRPLPGVATADSTAIVPPRRILPRVMISERRHVAGCRVDSGTVELAATISARGNVENIRIMKQSPNQCIDRLAIKSIQEWRFVPATRNGQPVSVPLRATWKWR